MGYQVPVEIVIQAPVEKHDVRADVVEMVARLLARADNLDPDDDMRCHPAGQNSVLCDLTAMPAPRWMTYQDRALELIRKAVAPKESR